MDASSPHPRFTASIPGQSGSAGIRMASHRARYDRDGAGTNWNSSICKALVLSPPSEFQH